MAVLEKKKVTYVCPPTKCDLCSAPFWKKEGEVFFDCRVKGGTAWGYLCPTCFSKHGVGLGTGMGQRYEYDPTFDDGCFMKTGG